MERIGKMGLLDGLLGKKKQSATGPRPAMPSTVPLKRPDPLYDNMNNYIIVILDSCRYDSFMTAEPKVITKLGPVEARWSYASWTAPSHYNLLMGLLPHTSPPHVYASDYYKEDFLRFNERFGAKDVEFASFVPHLFMPTYLRNTLGYYTHAKVSLPVLNPKTVINRDFDTFRLMDKHNDMNAMLDEMTFPGDRPSFYMLNVGETHYPYARPTEPKNAWPRLSGVHGVFKHLDDHVVQGKLKTDTATQPFFDQEKLDLLRARQIDTIQYLESVFERLYDMVPKNTYITVTSDHGELFGEKGYFGHGPIQHDKVYEVPFLEGKIR
jgi:hypothetical protein